MCDRDKENKKIFLSFHVGIADYQENPQAIKNNPPRVYSEPSTPHEHVYNYTRFTLSTCCTCCTRAKCLRCAEVAPVRNVYVVKMFTLPTCCTCAKCLRCDLIVDGGGVQHATPFAHGGVDLIVDGAKMVHGWTLWHGVNM